MGLVSYVERKAVGILRIRKQQGLLKYSIGYLKRPYYRYLQKKYGFDKWHINPYELRAYAVEMVKYVNRSNVGGYCNTVCEVGCGIGDILRNVRAKKKIGVDLSDKVIQCAIGLDRKSDYYTGGFDKLCAVAPKDIDVLITVNFIHNIEPSELADYYKMVMDSKNVQTVIVDTVDAAGYKYKHDFGTLLPGYKIDQCIFDYGGRKVLVLRKRE